MDLNESASAVHCPGQLELFPVTTGRTVTYEYARPDGQPSTDADFEQARKLTAA
ncbi:hypothetical protein [Streptomyces sp. H27-C3]|uniref:hypothetical protein n=1 Tax=Streptomyces sp. H27-C3 TaxID=3046305 RepID=UPI0024BB766F|nr:hypothetical protein [Streptomyces sp. H27-C3]MDJ0464952.1 hypothetical protein [Streptomyces sp. H27-C3]